VKNDEEYSEIEFIKDPNTIAEIRKMKQMTNGHFASKGD
jgi:hypothetical protein